MRFPSTGPIPWAVPEPARAGAEPSSTTRDQPASWADAQAGQPGGTASAASAAPGPDGPRPGLIGDVVDPRPARRLDVPFQGRVVDVAVDEVDLGKAGVVRREYTNHPGSVIVVALDDDDNVLLLRQYRHPVGAFLWELPAGLLDIDGEDPHIAAARELAEEADVHAARWEVLVDLLPSPGGSNEAARVYLARDLTPVPEPERHVREAEEADMVAVPVPLEEAAALALAGRLHNGPTVAGILAAAIGRASSWRTLRPVTSPWEYRRN
ncbi:NUDIX hydrolase [Myceligenerans pegani]|uniref:NUDIX hydrolase n=1 Tax=Myceligenerans pegani TaxID=2776917 RepID=UPI00299EC7B8|nr:NUDIX hydrolase [Myceligenerans sp. TRM 65318]